MSEKLSVEFDDLQIRGDTSGGMHCWPPASIDA
jgi:hypothetical protein